MIETCKDCRHCDIQNRVYRVWDKNGLHFVEDKKYRCSKFSKYVSPINRCEHINDPVAYKPKPEIVEIE